MGMTAPRTVRRRTALGLAVGAVAAAALGGSSRARGRARARARVLVIGGGFAGGACALELRRLDPSLDVEIIDPEERYVSCPMSNEVLVKLRTLESLRIARAGLEQRGVRVIRDRAKAIDARRRLVTLERGAARSYERLVLAPGIRFLWGRPQGYTEAVAQRMPHAWQAGAQTLVLAAQIASLRAGGVVAISVPAGPMRCPPGPFERASLIAGYLKPRNARAKVLIFDANNRFPKQDVFTEAWRELYPGMIEWIPVVSGGAVERVDPASMTLHTAQGSQRADVINIIPPQAPAEIAADAGLAEGHGWCPVEAPTFASTLAPDIHVIGDACIADPMPKAASSASSQARCCARAIAAALGGAGARASAAGASLESVCYSLLAPDRALSIRARFEIKDGAIERLAPADEPGASPAQSALAAEQWFARLKLDSFGG